jgi:hypothetical protein
LSGPSIRDADLRIVGCDPPDFKIEALESERPKNAGLASASACEVVDTLPMQSFLPGGGIEYESALTGHAATFLPVLSSYLSTVK